MVKQLTFLIISALIFSVAFVSCSEKKVDKKTEVAQFMEQKSYLKAKQIIIALRSDFPHDKQLLSWEKTCDEFIAQSEYDKIWKKAEAKNSYKDWIKAMIKVKKVENSNKKMVDELIKKATLKTIESGASELKDGTLLGLLEKLQVRYMVITKKERLTWITKFFKEGRFPIKEWKDTFISKYPELLDEKENFVGFPQPEKKDTKDSKKTKKG